MPNLKGLPILGELVPEGLPYPAVYLVEFEPESLWYETSFMLASYAATHGIRTDYHTLMRTPDELRETFRNLGVDPEKLENERMLRLMDSYTITTGQSPKSLKWSSERSLNLLDWNDNPWQGFENSPYVLHIDDNNSVLLQYNDEKAFVDWIRVGDHLASRATPNVIVFHSVIAGVASPAFYRQLEATCSGIIDFKTAEREEAIEHFVRVRMLRGQAHDSRWRVIRLLRNGEVQFAEAEKTKDHSSDLMDQTARSGLSTSSATMPDSGRKLSAIMFTDMVGYTSLSQKDETLSLAMLEEQRKLVRPVLTRFNGREVKTIGDAFLIEFPSALEAVKCAYEIQKAARAFNISTPEERRVNLRIGIHLGDVVESNGDILGDAVNVASRIGPLAEKGGVSLTRQVYDQVQNKFELPLESLGTQTLKNVGKPVELYRIALPWQEARISSSAQLDKKRIAVLPFANISASSSDEYFSDGMTEELITALSKIRSLGVIARTSIIRYKGLTKPVSEIARELGVGTVLEGSVRIAGKKLRITAQLIDATSEEHLWSDVYDRDLEDVFAIQSEIAKRIAKALRVRVLQGETIRLEKKATGIPEAYPLYLKGRHSLNTRTEKGLKEAIRQFESAIKHDPNFALAYTGLADAYSILASYSLEYIPPREGFPKAKAAAQKALALDDQLGEAHASLGLVKFYYDWDWKGAEAEFKKALELNPGYAQAHQYYADFVKSFGRFDEALKEMREALKLDPLSYSINTGIGHVLYLSRQYDKAIDHYRRVVESDPEFVPARLWFGRPFMQKGMFKEAIEQVEQGVKLSKESTVSLATLAQAYASAGNKTGAQKILDRLLERSKTQYVPSYWIALVQMSLGNEDEAVKWLEKAYHERSSWLVWANIEPRFDSLRSDQRFTSLLARIGFKPTKPPPEAGENVRDPGLAKAV